MCVLCCLGVSCYTYFVFDLFFFFKQKTAYDMRISDWSSDVCSSDLVNWPDGSFDLHFRGVGDAKQLGLQLHDSAKADAFRRHPPGDRAANYRDAALPTVVPRPGSNLSPTVFVPNILRLSLRLLISGAGEYPALLTIATQAYRERAQNRTSVRTRALCLRLLIFGAGGYLLLIEMALPRERALGQNRARVGRRPVRGDLGGISTLHYGQRLSRAYRIAQPFEHLRDRAAGTGSHNRFTGRRRGNCALRKDFGAKARSEEHTSELQSLMRISYAVFC